MYVYYVSTQLYTGAIEAGSLPVKSSPLTCLQGALRLLQACPRQASRSGAHAGVSGPASCLLNAPLRPGRPGAGSRAGPAGPVSGPLA